MLHCFQNVYRQQPIKSVYFNTLWTCWRKPNTNGWITGISVIIYCNLIGFVFSLNRIPFICNTNETQQVDDKLKLIRFMFCLLYHLPTAFNRLIKLSHSMFVMQTLLSKNTHYYDITNLQKQSFIIHSGSKVYLHYA
jgi:hypothetical protein